MVDVQRAEPAGSAGKPAMSLPEKELVEYRTARSKTFELPGCGAMSGCGITGHSGRQAGTVRNLGSYFPFKCNHSVGGDSGGPYFKGHAAKGIHYVAAVSALSSSAAPERRRII
jgi:hypothetical protein